MQLLTTMTKMAIRLCSMPKVLRFLQRRGMSSQLGMNMAGVGYVTDIEGDLGYWTKYLSTSRVLNRISPKKIILNDDYHFVYGGDVCDRGEGCLRVMSDLIALKESYPDRVHLILGNRDINKLRIMSSMHPEVIKANPHTYWVTPTPADLAASGYLTGDAEAKMKWILGKSMGAPHGYQLRQQELLALGRPGTAAWQSFLQALCPQEGLLTRYLELGQLAARIGDVLFVHGAVHEHNMGWVPPSFAQTVGPRAPDHKVAAPTAFPSSPLLQTGHHVQTVDAWVTALNGFVQAEVADYRQRTAQFLDTLACDPAGAPLASASVSASSSADAVPPATSGASGQIWEAAGGYAHPQPGSRLLQYGMGRLPDGAPNPSIVYSSYMRQRQVAGTTPGAPRMVVTEAAPMSEATASWLKQGGVGKVVVGHQPVGDAPLYMVTQGVQVLSMDTAYSKNVQWPRSQLEDTVSSSTATPTSASSMWCTAAEIDAHGETPAGPGKSTDTQATTKASNNSTSTRSPQAGFEVFFHPPVEPTALDKAGKCAGAPVEVTGFLSSGHAFSCVYGHTADGAVDPYLGRTTENGWTVRAAGVQGGLDQSHIEPGECYLLSQVDGFTFRNRLVHRADMPAEFTP